MNASSTRPTPLPSSAASDFLPTPANPGLWVYAPPEWKVTPRAVFACACGYVRQVTGRDHVLEMVTNHHNHAEICSLNGESAGVPASRVNRGAVDAEGSPQKKAERPGGLIPDRSTSPVSAA